MSGGSWNYAYHGVEEMASGLQVEGIEYLERQIKANEHRAKFGKLLHLVAKAMHDIEWVDSGDCGFGDEIESIEKVFQFIKDNE